MAPKGMVTMKQAGMILGCSMRTIQRYVEDGTIPESAIFRRRRRVFLRPEKLTKILKGCGMK